MMMINHPDHGRSLSYDDSLVMMERQDSLSTDQQQQELESQAMATTNTTMKSCGRRLHVGGQEGDEASLATRSNADSSSAPSSTDRQRLRRRRIIAKLRPQHQPATRGGVYTRNLLHRTGSSDSPQRGRDNENGSSSSSVSRLERRYPLTFTTSQLTEVTDEDVDDETASRTTRDTTGSRSTSTWTTTITRTRSVVRAVRRGETTDALKRRSMLAPLSPTPPSPRSTTSSTVMSAQSSQFQYTQEQQQQQPRMVHHRTQFFSKGYIPPPVTMSPPRERDPGGKYSSSNLRTRSLVERQRVTGKSHLESKYPYYVCDYEDEEVPFDQMSMRSDDNNGGDDDGNCDGDEGMGQQQLADGDDEFTEQHKHHQSNGYVSTGFSSPSMPNPSKFDSPSIVGPPSIERAANHRAMVDPSQYPPSSTSSTTTNTTNTTSMLKRALRDGEEDYDDDTESVPFDQKSERSIMSPSSPCHSPIYQLDLARLSESRTASTDYDEGDDNFGDKDEDEFNSELGGCDGYNNECNGDAWKHAQPRRHHSIGLPPPRRSVRSGEKGGDNDLANRNFVPDSNPYAVESAASEDARMRTGYIPQQDESLPPSDLHGGKEGYSKLQRAAAASVRRLQAGHHFEDEDDRDGMDEPGRQHNLAVRTQLSLGSESREEQLVLSPETAKQSVPRRLPTKHHSPDETRENCEVDNGTEIANCISKSIDDNDFSFLSSNNNDTTMTTATTATNIANITATSGEDGTTSDEGDSGNPMDRQAQAATPTWTVPPGNTTSAARVEPKIVIGAPSYRLQPPRILPPSVRPFFAGGGDNLEIPPDEATETDASGASDLVNLDNGDEPHVAGSGLDQTYEEFGVGDSSSMISSNGPTILRPAMQQHLREEQPGLHRCLYPSSGGKDLALVGLEAPTNEDSDSIFDFDEEGRQRRKPLPLPPSSSRSNSKQSNRYSNSGSGSNTSTTKSSSNSRRAARRSQQRQRAQMDDGDDTSLEHAYGAVSPPPTSLQERTQAAWKRKSAKAAAAAAANAAPADVAPSSTVAVAPSQPPLKSITSGNRHDGNHRSDNNSKESSKSDSVGNRSASNHSRRPQTVTFGTANDNTVQYFEPHKDNDNDDDDTDTEDNTFADNTLGSRSLNSTYTKSNESELEDVLADILLIGSGEGNRPGRRKFKHRPDLQYKLQNLEVADDETLETYDNNANLGVMQSPCRPPPAYARLGSASKTQGLSAPIKTKQPSRNEKGEGDSVDNHSLMDVWQYMEGGLKTVSSALGLESTRSKDGGDIPAEEKKTESAPSETKPPQPPTTAPTIDTTTSSKLVEAPKRLKGILGYASNVIYGTSSTSCEPDTTVESEVVRELRRGESEPEDATIEGSQPPPPALEQDARLVDLATQAAKSMHTLQGCEFDESYDIDIVSDIKFIVVDLDLPLGLIFQENETGCWVTKVLDEGSASKTNSVLVGDQLAAIDGTSAITMKVDEIAQMIKDKNADIELTFLRYVGPVVSLGDYVEEEGYEVNATIRTPSRVKIASDNSSNGSAGAQEKKEAATLEETPTATASSTASASQASSSANSSSGGKEKKPKKKTVLDPPGLKNPSHEKPKPQQRGVRFRFFRRRKHKATTQ